MRDLFLEALFPDILLRSGSNNFKLGSQPSQSEKSRRYPDEQMVSQNNYTLKHNSLTKSSSWRGAHCLLVYGKYGWPPYYSSKPKANEVWRFENSHCGGRAVSKTHSDKICPSSTFPGKYLRKWNPATQTRRSPTREHQQQHRHHHLRRLLIPRIFISFAMISNNKLFQNFTRIPRLSSPISTRNFLLGHMEVDRNGKRVLAEPTTDTASAWHEVISSCRITLFSDILWNSNTWLSIDGFTCLNH